MSDRMGSSRAPPSPLSPGASPSSKVSKQPEKPPLPKAFVAALCLCSCAHGYIMTNLFSYAGLMCADLGWVEDRDSAGFIAGFLTSANTLGRTFTASLFRCLDGVAGLAGEVCTVPDAQAGPHELNRPRDTVKSRG